MSEKIIFISDSEYPRFQASEKVMKKLYPTDTEIISQWREAKVDLDSALNHISLSINQKKTTSHLLVVDFSFFYELTVKKYRNLISLPNATLSA